MSKSDKRAISAYMNYLEQNGYTEVKRVKTPADIKAYKGGEPFYFEIKKTSKRDMYFGAATETEWAKAVEDSSHYKFVVVKDDDTEKFVFIEYSLEELRPLCSVPPFKIYFNIDMASASGLEFYYNEQPIDTVKRVKKSYKSEDTAKRSISFREDNNNELFGVLHEAFQKLRKH